MQPATQTDSAHEIAKIVATMPVERAAQVYDFALFLKTWPASVPTPIVEGDIVEGDVESDDCLMSAAS
jgi:hypothetical protein